MGYTTRNSGGVPANFKNYFVIEFDKPFTYEATFSNDVQPEKPDGSVPVTLKEGKLEQTDFHTGAVIGFKTKKGEVVHARVASSFISPEQAIQNLKELGGDSFEVLVQKGKDAWNEVLGKVEVEGGTLDQYRTSILACTVPCCSRVNSMNWMPMGSLFITVLTMGKHYRDICIRIQDSGIHSVACSLS